MHSIGRWIVLGFVMLILCFADAITRRIFEKPENEEDEKARKKLIEREDRDIELDQE